MNSSSTCKHRNMKLCDDCGKPMCADCGAACGCHHGQMSESRDDDEEMAG